MKTLIINGSPKLDGDTASLIKAFLSKLEGEYMLLTHSSNIAPCNDCRYCREKSGCAIKDDMQEVYKYINECDNVVLASPIWFSSLSGPLLNIASRIQTLYSAMHFRKEKSTSRVKNGIIILAGAEKGTELIPAQNAATIMKFMNVKRPIAAYVYSLDTDATPACEDAEALKAAENAAMLLNKLNREKWG